MALEGWLFDVDGTLVDSNALHVDAWMRAFTKNGYSVARDRIEIEIGKGGDHLIPDVLGRAAEKEKGKALRNAHDEAYAALAKERGVSLFPGALDLLATLRRRGVRTAVATSSNEEQLEVTERACGVRLRDVVDVIADGGDVERSKPEPDVVHAALRKLGLGAAQCALTGDTPWDAEAGRRAGVAFVGVTIGGNDAKTLARSGARVVCVDVAEVGARLEEVMRRVSPGSIHYDARTLDGLMAEALGAAEEAMARGEVPIGAVLARGDGRILARGHDRFVATREKTAHAEIEALRAVAAATPAGEDPFAAGDAILVSTLEPCVMCFGAAMECAIDLVVFGLRAPADSGTGRVDPPESVENQMSRVIGDVRARESRALFEKWLTRPDRLPSQEPYVRRLLGAT